MQLLDLSSEDIAGLVHKIKGGDWIVDSHKIYALSGDPVGFLGSHYCLRINANNVKDNADTNTLRFFIKTIPESDGHAEYVNEIGVFKKEVVFQKKLLSSLHKATSFLDHQWSAKCHIAKDTLLVFDDLSLKNYKLAPGREIFDFDHCVAALKTLADFHASSIIWEEENKKINDQFFSIDDVHPDVITEICYVREKGHLRNEWLKSVTNATVHLCKLIGRENEAHRIPGMIDEAISVVGPSNEWRNVLSHADLWSNNFMFKYNKDGTVKHCVLLDYQFTRYAPPALDLMSCIHLVAPLELRNKNMKNFLNIYYQRLTDVLSTAGLNISEILPRKQFDQGLERYKVIGILEAIFFGTTIWVPGKVFKECMNDTSMCLESFLENRSKMVEIAFEQDDFFKHQMTDLAKELLNYSKESA